MRGGKTMDSLKVELINTGTELLLGRVVNTNAAWLGEQLFRIGARVVRQTVVPDGPAICEAMQEAVRRCDLVIASGGLGPTSDDVTRQAIAETYGVPLEENAQEVERLQVYFKARGQVMSPDNLQQALIPRGARILPNPYGTASGLWMPGLCSQNVAGMIALPGPPRELIPMVESRVLPELKKLIGDNPIEMKNIKIVELGESRLHELVDKRLASIKGLEWGYCARVGEVDVRLIGQEAAIAEASEALQVIVGDYMLSEDDASLSEVVVRLLTEKHWSVATAESCTGGMIASAITDVAGSSEVFRYGWVTYANEAKMQELGVKAEILEQYGAVSEPVALAMAEGALKQSKADIAVAVSGIAGPGGGTAEKPVGTVCIAWASKHGKTRVETFHLIGLDRDGFRRKTVLVALQGIWKLVRPV